MLSDFLCEQSYLYISHASLSLSLFLVLVLFHSLVLILVLVSTYRHPPWETLQRGVDRIGRGAIRPAIARLKYGPGARYYNKKGRGARHKYRPGARD